MHNLNASKSKEEISSGIHKGRFGSVVIRNKVLLETLENICRDDTLSSATARSVVCTNDNFQLLLFNFSFKL